MGVIIMDGCHDHHRTLTRSDQFGDQLLDKAGIMALATLPSLDELRGKIIGLVQAPATKIAGVLAAPGGQLARVLNAYATKDAA